MKYEIVSKPSYSLLNITLERGEEVLAEAGAMVYMRGVELKTETRGGFFGGIHEVQVEGRLVVDTGHIVAFEDTLDFKVRKAGSLKATILSGEGLVAEFSGVGRVWIQTRSIADYVGWLSSLMPSK
ncbi:protein of unknown function DUF124 [Ferroglobus placidus DSM 10642]|uniref:TIGR00266 family protein n=1 Tax=Ferroglobus placidus (strain DSM 10642 / AEDII12DO) TaxID=589924 RepID=D3S042_FERPA|nr:TIGR00266 family protein [Ferroglobus placidus]ADC66105.1 protein of unknown function DUF124 [Ferroglobus placidus DSM 10642]